MTSQKNDNELFARAAALAAASRTVPLWGGAKAILRDAEKFYNYLMASSYSFSATPELADFLGGFDKAEKKEETDPAEPQTNIDPQPIVRAHRPAALSPISKSILRVCIEEHRATSDYIDATQIAGIMNKSPSTINYHFVRFVKEGYMGRLSHQKYWPKLNFDGQPLSPLVQKVPDGYAKGYKPMTSPIGTAARITQ